MSRRPSQAASTKTNDAAGGGTTQDAHLAYHSRIEASLQCLKTLLSPSQANSKAWRLIHPQSGTSTGSGTNNPQSTTNPPINASSISSLSSIVGSQNMDHLQSSDSIPSTSRQTLDNATAMLGQPTIVHVHRRTATRASKDLSTSTATIAPGSSNSSNSQQPPLLPPNSSTGADIYRATCYIPVKGEEELSNLEWSDVQDAFRRLVATPECRPAWDRIVEESEIVEEVDADTRISRTVFKLGWPASPRDAITVSRTLMDSKSLIDISCSLPRSPDAPVYLRPAPPYVRSHVNLFAWCLERSAYSGKPHVKLTCFWSWDLRGAWIGMPAGGIGARLPNLITSLVQHVKDGDALHVPFLSHYGRNVELTNRSFNSSRDMVTVEYQVVCDDAQELNQNKEEARDLQLEWSLPAAEGWDVHVDVKPLDNHKHSSVEWKSTATRAIQSGRQSARMTFNVQHLQSEGPTGRSLLAEGIRGRITVQRIAASQDVKLRINDKPFAVEELQLTEQEIISSKIDLDLTTGSSSLADDSASISNMSMRSEVSSASATTMGDDIIKRAATPSSISGTASKRQTLDVMGSPMQASLSSGRPAPDRNTAIASIIRRNYIYFTSLLQEPEAKWKHFSDTRGVTITQLDSIDPTLVVYRAEATFVGVGVWDLFAAIANAGVKNSWDKGAEESRLVEDLGDSSKVWWNKLKGTWPVASRDSVVVETVYKSPSSIHIFSFSSDDKKLFPGIPSPDTGAIRTQIDLRGWSIESLSPTTAHITLIEQSDPKGWTSKSSATPAAMTAAVAGVGDFAIKQGGPPITTRLLGGKIRQMKYEADKSSYRIEYDLAENHSEDLSGNVECEIRCDVETWSPSLDVVVDPPPINVSCLRRHKLSQGGSGLWLTIEQPIASLEDDPSRITVRKANNKEKGVVYVNGARMKVDMDDLKDAEVTQLREQKRTKPKRVPLDLVNESPRRLMIGSASPVGSISRAGTPTSANGVSTASSNLAAITNAGANGNGSTNSVPTEQTTMDVFSDEKPRQPMTCALDVLFLLRRIHAERSPDPAGNPAGWSLVANRNGLYTRRKMMQSISPTVIVQRGDKVVEGLTAEDILSVISNVQCRKVWDERVEATTNLESYGNGASTALFTTKGSFPFRGRAFSLASLVARSGPRASQFGNPSAPTVYFHASSSYSMSQSTFSAMKLNPSGLPMGKVLIDGWILETLDPYSSTLNYQIPSTRVTHLVAVDYAGSLPITVNAMWNTQLSRSIAHVEEYLKQQGTLPTLRAPPSCMEVLGDGRDEDHDLIWNLSDDKTKRACTLLSNDFNNVTKVYNVLVTLDAASSLVEETSTPLAVPLPRRAALSNASTTRGIANAATMFSSPSSDANLSSPSNAVVEGGTSVDSAPLSRTTSISSLRSVTSRPRPSVIRKETKKPSDLVVLDVEVELRHYERGYDIILKSMLGDEKAKETEDDDDESLPAETPRASAPSEQKEFPSLSSKESTENKENKIGTSDIIWPLEIPSEDADEVLPLSVSTFDLPPSAVLAATLDPSARPKKHLVRVTLPTATFMGTARSNPFNGPELDEAPAWYDKVRERGALISLELKPRGGEVTNFGSPVSNGSASFDNQKGTSGSSTPSDSGMSDQGETDSQQVPVYYKGVRISVTHVNKTSAMLQRESDNEQEYAILKRIAPPAPPRAEGQPTPAGMSMHKRRETAETKLEERLPVQLQSPLAKSFKFIRDASESAAEKVNAEEQAKKDGNVISPSSSVGDTTIGLTPMANRANQLTPSNSTLANASSSTPTPTTRIANPSTPASAASAQIMSILNSYPLSRLGGGASTAVSTTVANGGLFSRRTDADADVNGSMSGADGEKGKANGDQRGIVGGTDDENATTMPGQLIIATEQIRKRIVDIRFTWSTMILVALIAFLLGSLVRSLLEPADFILVNKLKGTTGLRGEGGQAIEAAAVREIKKLFDQGQGPQIGEPNSPHHSVAWRELKRLIELRNLFGGRWDLVIAAVRR